MTVRVLIVDDDPLVRAGLRTMLGGRDDLAVVGEADDGARVPGAIATHRPDVVLMDVRMPTVDGVTAIERIVDGPAVLVLTTFDADATVLRALRAGAAGFLTKDTPPAEIVDAVLRVAAGEPVLSASATRQLIAHATDPDRDRRRALARHRLAALTERERDVARAVRDGGSNADIGVALHLSTATVKAYVSRLLDRLDLANRTQLALLVHDAE